MFRLNQYFGFSHCQLFLLLLLILYCQMVATQDDWLIKRREYVVHHRHLGDGYLTVMKNGEGCGNLSDVQTLPAVDGSTDFYFTLTWEGDDIWSNGGELHNAYQPNEITYYNSYDSNGTCTLSPRLYEFHPRFNDYYIKERHSGKCVTFDGVGNRPLLTECEYEYSQVWALNRKALNGTGMMKKGE